MPAIIGGMAKLQAQLMEIGLEFTPQNLMPGAAIILARAQELCPVDTGFLRDSAFMQISSDDVEIGFSAEYASYVEFGTRKMQAQPFLRPAFDDAELEALSAIVDAIEADLRDITA